MMRKFLCLLIAMLLLSLCLTSCGLSVPRPEIKKAEFDFSVTYEINGEIKTVQGTYVCEYNGTDWAIDAGYHRDWIGYIKDGASEEIIKLEVAENGELVELNLDFEPGHFMGDSCCEGDEPFEPWISVRIEDNEGLSFENRADYIAEAYGAKIISYEYDAPIENTFGILEKNLREKNI